MKISKSNWLTLGISAVVLITIVVIALMILLPQQSVVLDASTINYEAVKKSDYVYTQTKDITKEALVKEYTITTEQMDNFKEKNQYVAGNSDPFTPAGTTTNNNGASSNNSTNNSSSNSGSSTNTNNSNSSTSTSTTQKITNSNGGQANPPSTNK